MNAFTSNKKLIDGKVFKKSNDCKKGGEKRAKNLAGLPINIKHNHEPEKAKLGKLKINGKIVNDSYA